MVFFGLKAAVLAVVVEAVVRIGKRALKNRVMVALAALAFVAIFFFDVPFPAIVLAAAIVGFVGGRVALTSFPAAGHGGKGPTPATNRRSIACGQPAGWPHPAVGRSRRARGRGLAAVWSLPFALLSARARTASISRSPLFFSKMAVVTFGGAYAVLAYVAQQAVEHVRLAAARRDAGRPGHGRDDARPADHGAAVRGLHGGLPRPGGARPAVRPARWAACCATWVTFAPCFLWIFLGAPYIEALRGNRNLSAALSAITAAVVGVILNLAVWFTVNTVFGQVDDVYALGMHLLVPAWGTLNLPSLAIAAFAALAIFRWKTSMLKTIAASVALGVAYHVVRRAVA